MEILQTFYDGIKSFLPLTVTVVISVLVIFLVRKFLEHQDAGNRKRPFRMQVVTLLLSFAALLFVIMAMPIGDSLRGQLLSLIGIIFSAAIALSSTTFIGNAFAGMMLRAVRSFRSGDFIMVNEFFGRVSERGLFHIEIQSEDRDLITMPNLFLVTNPVRVVRGSGTIVSAEVSLGYDLPRKKIEEILLKAAADAELEEPFVYITKLGDFSVTYRIAGLLTEVKLLISARSRLREMVMDGLHGGDVEIVSPTFMNTRALNGMKRFIPKKQGKGEASYNGKDKSIPENIVFDKAEEAESLEKMQERYATLGDELNSVKERIKVAIDATLKDELKLHKEWLEKRRANLAEIIRQKESDDNQD